MDDPTTRNTKLAHLDPLVGRWELGSEMGSGWTRFDWHPSGAFLIQYTDMDGREALPAEVVASLPIPSTIVIGLDETSGELQGLYSDNRGVLRIYGVSVGDGIWRMWRNAPQFHQRFEGRISDDGQAIEAVWEKSSDGESWELDFQIRYRKTP